MYLNGPAHLSQKSLLKLERAIVQDQKTFGMILANSKALEWIEIQSVKIGMLTELDRITNVADRQVGFGLVIQVQDTSKSSLCLKQLCRMFTKVAAVKFFETSCGNICECFGDIDAEYCYEGMTKCKFEETKLDNFDFEQTIMEGYWGDAYQGLLVKSRDSSRTIFIEL